MENNMIFKKWFNRKVLEAIVSEHQRNALLAKPVETYVSQSIDCDKGIRFKVLKAQGGTVVETSLWDSRKSDNNYGLYVIRDDEDLGQGISKIITIESLKS
jgi:hypothetical protein